MSDTPIPDEQSDPAAAQYNRAQRAAVNAAMLLPLGASGQPDGKPASTPSPGVPVAPIS